MIPRSYVHGCSGGERWFWPMGLGGAPPCAMAQPAAPTWHLALRWVDDVLVCAREWNDAQPAPVVTQTDYLWDGDQIAEIITRLDYGDGTEPDEQGRDVWRWVDDRPREVCYVSGMGRGAGPVQRWTWDDAGQRARITCTAGGSRLAQSVLYDAAGRLVRVERERPVASERAAGLVAAADVELVVELEWAAAGIVAARARLAGHPTADVVFIRDVDGRLISQRGADGTTIYQYPEAP